MSAESTITRALTASPLIAVTLYAAVTCGLLLLAGVSVADVLSHRQQLAQTSDLLDQVRGRKAGTGGGALVENAGDGRDCEHQQNDDRRQVAERGEQPAQRSSA